MPAIDNSMEQTIRQVTDLANEVIKTNERLSMLEKDASFITDFVMQHDKDFSATITHMDEHITQLKTTLGEVQSQLKNARIAFELLIAQLKEACPQNMFEHAQARAEAWNPHLFVTKYELKRTLRDV